MPAPLVQVAVGRNETRYPAERAGSYVTTLSGQVSEHAWVFLVARDPHEWHRAKVDRGRLKSVGGYRHVLIETTFNQEAE